jgi:SNF2 family DNA or RNA helicase
MKGKGYALLFEQGCGKTLTAVAIMGRLYLDRKVKKLLVLAPLSVCPVWPKEFAQYADFPTHCIVMPELIAGNQKKRLFENMEKQTLYDGLNIIVMNYEALRTKRVFEAVQSWMPDAVICDESQRIKNPQAQQSKAAHAIGDIAKYKLILSGTPVCNTPLDYWSQYRFLDKSVFGPSYYAFRNRYAKHGGFQNHEVIGILHLGELSGKAHSIASRVRKDDALDLPPYITQTLYCELEPLARAAYETLERVGAIELEAVGKVTAPMVITRMMRLAQLTGGYFVGMNGNAPEETPQAVSTAKVILLKDTVKDLVDAGHKVVIFCRFVPEIKLLYEVLTDMFKTTGMAQYYEPVRMMYGDTPGEERGRIVEEFQTDPDIKVFIAQTHTAGLGITLHAADTCIFYSPDFSYTDYAQARDRIHRGGQTKPCLCIHLCCRDTIDELAFAAIEQKKGLADSAVDTWRSFLH